MPLVRVAVDPRQLVRLLQAAQAVNAERVELVYYLSARPIGVIATNAEGQAFDGLIVPLFPPKGEQ
jgi:hypothetical protein